MHSYYKCQESGLCTTYWVLLFIGTPEACEKSYRNFWAVRFGADPQFPSPWRFSTAQVKWPSLLTRPCLTKVTRKKWKTLLAPTKDMQLCLWYWKLGYVWGLNSVCHHSFLQEGHSGEKVLPHSGWILHRCVWIQRTQWIYRKFCLN